MAAMCEYELVAIVSPDASDEVVAGKIDGVSQLIIGRQGEVDETQRWGKKRLDYPIKKYIEGNFTLLRFKIEPAYIRELRAVLETDVDVLRYLVVKRSK
ncbi:MAG TPA: 30S ribosomal protein S6 [Propionibacteriaceae bacterium]|nr:30S ribosomal protein S6 [Propionibacteriaceae bacterium]